MLGAVLGGNNALQNAAVLERHVRAEAAPLISHHHRALVGG